MKTSVFKRKPEFWAAFAFALIACCAVAALFLYSLFSQSSLAVMVAALVAVGAISIAVGNALVNTVTTVAVRPGTVEIRFLGRKKVSFSKADAILISTALWGIPAELTIRHCKQVVSIGTYTWFKDARELEKAVQQALRTKAKNLGIITSRAA